MNCLALDTRNQLWIGTPSGLRVLSNTNLFISETELNVSSIIIQEGDLAQELFYQQTILDIVVDGANNKWVSIADGGVFLVSSNGQETIYQFTKSNSPLPSNNVNDIDTLLFVSDYDIRQIINNLECIYYSFGVLNENTINKLIDKPKPYYIHQLLNYCYQSDYVNTINLIKMLYNKGYTPNDILLTFMKYLFEYNFINEIYAFTNRLNEDHKLHIYELLSSSYTIINGGTDTLLQLYGCISNIYIYIQNLLK